MYEVKVEDLSITDDVYPTAWPVPSQANLPGLQSLETILWLWQSQCHQKNFSNVPRKNLKVALLKDICFQQLFLRSSQARLLKTYKFSTRSTLDAQQRFIATVLMTIGAQQKTWAIPGMWRIFNLQERPLRACRSFKMCSKDIFQEAVMGCYRIVNAVHPAICSSRSFQNFLTASPQEHFKTRSLKRSYPYRI